MKRQSTTTERISSSARASATSSAVRTMLPTASSNNEPLGALRSTSPWPTGTGVSSPRQLMAVVSPRG